VSTSSQDDTTKAAKTKRDLGTEILAIYDVLDEGRKRVLESDAAQLMAEWRAAKV
jgi:hypothetical protein